MTKLPSCINIQEHESVCQFLELKGKVNYDMLTSDASLNNTNRRDVEEQREVLGLRKSASEQVKPMLQLSQGQKLTLQPFNLKKQVKTQEDIEHMVKEMQVSIKQDLDNISAALQEFDKYYFKDYPKIQASTVQRLFVVSFIIAGRLPRSKGPDPADWRGGAWVDGGSDPGQVDLQTARTQEQPL